MTRTRRAILPLLGPVVLGLAAAAPVAEAAAPVPPRPASATELVADVDGRTIALVEVGRYHCHDLEAPRIRCYATEADLEVGLESVTLSLASGTAYVEIFEQSWFGGSSMVVAQDYPVLALIGWNDRISSYVALNSETGTFFVDWFYGGAGSSFCCNQSQATLGSFNDAFSSVRRS